MEQLVLIADDSASARPADWRLDEATRSAGRRGVSLARQALARAAARHAGGSTEREQAA